MRTAGFLLALDQHLEIDGQPPLLAHERLCDEDRDQERPLVVGDPAGIEPIIPFIRFATGFPRCWGFQSASGENLLNRPKTSTGTFGGCVFL